ncbi:Nitrogen assimilation transcription factor nit-4-like protein 7 [Colletotrichum kahawae]|uniref:Nitrogen assimilation transcription factor nit-4-like protein 7 n=1 Tax=Colletotrichum kahawae TaxID=34407 RepID=A0AAD9XZ45_COLKA|nr:Nitrogen assimilation transcription factor nit-4-like protein 7 [Colletotrichum kahawae]
MSRLDTLRKRYERLEEENEDLRERIRYLCVRPLEEAVEIFNRLRSTGDAIHVLELVRTSDVLLGKRPLPGNVS